MKIKIFSKAKNPFRILVCSSFQKKSERMKKLITILTLISIPYFSFSQTTVDIEPPTDDTYVYEGNVSQINGSSSNLIVGKDVNGDELRILIKWDLSSLPNCISIVDAEIRLNKVDTDGPVTAGIYAITVSDTWDEGTATWNNQPTTATWYGNITFSSAGTYLIPVENLLQDWLTNGNNGVMLKWSSGSDGQIPTFESKEASGSDPRLTITYNTLTPPSVNPSSTNTTCGDDNGSVSANASSGTSPYTYSWSNGCTASTCSSLSSGTYTVTVTDANECTDIGSATVGSSSPATASVSTTQHTSCNDCDGEVTASGGVSYSWNNGCNTASCSDLCAGTYTVTVTDANGCTDTDNTTINSSNFSVSTTSIDVGSSSGDTSFTITTDDSWSVSKSCTWVSLDKTSGSGTSTITVSYEENTSTNSRSCDISVSCGTSSETVTVTQSGTVGVDEIESINDINIYPNPNTGNFVIEMEITKPQDLEIKLINVIGQTIYEEKISKYSGDYKKEIELPNIKSGVYYLNIETKEGVIRRKVIVQ